MGADGHIAIYHYAKVEKILKEINETIPDRKNWFLFPGYKLNWTVNNQPACLVYWDHGIGRKSKYGFKGQWQYELEYYIYNARAEGGYWKELANKWLIFRERCDKEAVIVEDQEVWT